MNEFIEKLIGRLEEQKIVVNGFSDIAWNNAVRMCIYEVYQLAEEYKGGLIEKLLEAKKNCSEDSNCSECPFGQIEDRCILNELQIESDNNGWNPCSERLPDKDMWCLATFESGGIDKIQYLASQKWWNGEMADNKVLAWKQIVPYHPEGEEL